MSTLASKYKKLKCLVGGNREKMKYEETFGMPMEEFYHITMPNPSIRRILAEIEFSIRLSKELGGKHDKTIEKAIDVLQCNMNKDGVLTKTACVEAEEVLLPLEAEAKEYELILAAHAHIDMNWMWGWQETVASTVATFQTMLKLMDEYSNFHFSQSQASVYKIIEDYAPELKPQMEKRIAEGRWEVTASAWVETDKNMPTEASLLNHIFYTRKYLKEHWGVDPKSLDLDFSPDTFGHSANVPEINSFGGVKYYYHCRGLDGKNALYRWKAPSGEDILVYREQYWYNSGVTPLPAIGLIDVAKRSGGLKTGLMVYGVGDHGGGPTRRDIERAIEMQDWRIFPKIRFGTFHDYFKVAEQVKDKLDLVEHEINYFAPGCYTTQSRIKLGNRHCEAALYDAQTTNVLASCHTGASYAEEQYETAWQNVLFTHFHDILTGSCVQESREHAMGLFAHSLAVAQTRGSLAMQSICRAIDTSAIKLDVKDYQSQAEGAGAGYGIERLTGFPAPERGNGKTRIFHIFNTTARTREQCCEITVWDWTGDLREINITDAEGRPLSFELIDSELKQYWDHKYFRILIRSEVPQFGFTTVVLREKDPQEYHVYLQPETRNNLPYNDVTLENEELKAVFSFRNGEMLSLVDKKTGKEWLRAGETGGLRLVDTENKTSNGWQIGRYIDISKSFKTTSFTALSGGLRNGLEIEQEIGNSKIKTSITLCEGDKFITVNIEADWHEITRNGSTVPVLVYLLPINECKEYLYDVPAGAVYRGAMEMDVPALQYAAAPDGKRATFIAADCKYGYRANENGLIATLINSSYSPDPYPERGIHKIRLSVGIADACAKELHEIAFNAHHKLAYQAGFSHDGSMATSQSLLDVECGTAVISQITRDSNENCITVYETCGKDTTVVITLPNVAKNLRLTNLDGEDIAGFLVKGNKATISLAKNKIAMLRFC